MAIETTVVGSYPKPPDEGQTFTVRKTHHAIERGDATPEDLKKAQDELVTEVIEEQEDAGIDLVTDGHGRWDDILTPFARPMSGFEIGGLLRWFDNNVYYRRPICTGPIEWRGPASVDAFKFAAVGCNEARQGRHPRPDHVRPALDRRALRRTTRSSSLRSLGCSRRKPSSSRRPARRSSRSTSRRCWMLPRTSSLRRARST